MQLVTMKCPKCGHSQEERLDCARCGIVFAKYHAMYPQDRDMPPEGQEAMVYSHPVPADTLSAEISELRQGVREIANRLSDVEFDRAERSLLRGDVKLVEQKVTGLAEDLRSRLLELESRVPDPEQITQGLSVAALDDLAERLGQFEEQLEGLAAQARPQDPETVEMIRGIATRQKGVEERIDKLIAGLQQGGESSRAAEKALEELRQAVQSATVRYSEIGELKKNHLVLQNEIETLRRDQEALRNQPANGTAARIAQLESEVAALRAELRQTLKRLESMEADFAAQLHEVRASAPANPDGAGMSSALAQLNSNLREEKAVWAKQSEFFSSELRRFEGWNQSVSTGLQETNDGLKESCRCIDGLTSDVRTLKQESMQLRSQLQTLQGRAQEPGMPCTATQPSPVEGDLHAIKEGLDQIRVFMQTLAQRL